MLAQVKQDQPSKFIFYTSDQLPKSAEYLFKNINSYQLILQKFITKALTYPEKKLSISFKMFLSESKDRLQFFILTFDEIVGQASFAPPRYPSFSKHTTVPSISILSTSQIIMEMLNTTNLLCDMLTQLKDNTIEDPKTPEFIKDFCLKSLVFYKQTQVVLKGYLRTFKVQKIDSR